MEECVESPLHPGPGLLALALVAGLLPAPVYAGSLVDRTAVAIPANAAMLRTGAFPRVAGNADDAVTTWADVVPSGPETTQGRESLKQTLIKRIGLTALILFFPPGYPTSVPSHNVTPPPPPPPGDGNHNPPPNNPGDPGGGGGDPPPANNPEPATLITGLLGSSLLGLFALWRRQKSGPRLTMGLLPTDR